MLFRTSNGLLVPVESAGPFEWQGPVPVVNACRCGLPFISYLHETETCMGYFSPPGHDHDRNSLNRPYVCEAGHVTRLSLRRSCPTPGCDWVGPGEGKVAQWPEVSP